MGDAAEDVLEGLCCEGCGEFFHDEEPGFPRRCEACAPTERQAEIKSRRPGYVFQSPIYASKAEKNRAKRHRRRDRRREGAAATEGSAP